jgi:hypothetical protein
MTKSQSSGVSLSHKLIDYLSRDDIHHILQTKLIDPLFNHIMSRILPYIILLCVLFVLLLLSVLLTLGIIIFQLRSGSTAAMVVAAT